MKVKVTYTVDLEDIPREADLLLDRVHASLDDLFIDLKKLGVTQSPGSELTAAQEIDDLRRKLYGVDTLLADTEAILRGYVATVNNQKSPPEPGEE